MKHPLILMTAACISLCGISWAVEEGQEKKEEKKAEAQEEKKAEEKKPEEKKAEEKKSEEKKTEGKKEDGKPAGDKPSDEKPAGDKEAKKKKPPMVPIFRMRDGARISGAPDLEKICVATPYGRLTVPRADLVRIRFCQEKDPAIDDRIKSEITRLGSEEFEARENAMVALREIGLPALKLLQEALKSSDEEIKNRAQTLITEIEESVSSEEGQADEDGIPIAGADDELMTTRFTIKGAIEERQFRVKSSYGELLVDRKDIISIVFQEFTPAEVEIEVNSNYLAPSNNWLETKIAVEKGDRLEISASGQVNLQNYGWVVGPEGTPNVGNHFENFPGGALVAKIGKSGKPFLVGPQYKDKANAGGKLMFGIAFRRGNISGAFTVKVKMKQQEAQ